jgi:hypothetical protein
MKEKKWMLGVPGNPMTHRLDNWIMKVKSDPFVPKAIRTIVVGYLEERVQKMIEIHITVLRSFVDSLVKNPEKYLGNQYIGSIISNRINDKLYKSGCGISQVEEKVHELRLEIQKYYEKYDPLK